LISSSLTFFNISCALSMVGGWRLAVGGS